MMRQAKRVGKGSAATAGHLQTRHCKAAAYPALLGSHHLNTLGIVSIKHLPNCSHAMQNYATQPTSQHGTNDKDAGRQSTKPSFHRMSSAFAAYALQ